MQILLPIAGITVNIWLIIGIGGIIGLLSGLLGIGGGFLLTPILMMFGLPPTVATASSTNAIVATSASGFAAHFRLHNVDLRMGSILLVGGLIGSEMGVRCIYILRRVGHVDLFITMTYILILSLVGSFILRDSRRRMRRRGVVASKSNRAHARGFFTRLPLQMNFPHSRVRHSIFLPFALGVFVGVITGIMGLAGGFILIPMMVSLLGMDAHVAAGTNLYRALFTCAGATVMQAGTNHTVDFVLVLLVAAGSTIGAQIGAHLSGRLRGEQLMILLGIIVLGVMVTLVISRVLPPSLPLSRLAELEVAKPMREVVSWLVPRLGF